MHSDVALSLLDPILNKYQSQEGALITMLQEVQEVYGYLPEEALARLSQETKISMSLIYAVVTFYAQFYLAPRGKNTIRVCRGTACHVRGGNTILRLVKEYLGIEEGETTFDLEYTLETVACIGVCALAPNIVTGNETHGHMTSKKVAQLFGDRSRRG